MSKVITGPADSPYQNVRPCFPQRYVHTAMKNSEVKRFRENLLISKAELARKAGLSVLTVDRIEKGKGCRPETKRKILMALGLKLSDREKLFND